MIARKSALVLTIQIINGLLGYFALFIIARFMDASDFALGVVSFGYGFVSLFFIVGKAGFDNAHVKIVSEGKDLGACNGTYMSIKLALIGVMILFISGSIYIWRNVLNRGFESHYHEQVIWVFLAYFILWSLTQTFKSTFTARREIAKAQIPMFFETLSRVVATFFVVYYDLGILALAYTYLIGEIFVFISGFYFFYGYSVKLPSKELFKQYIVFAYPLAFVVACSTIMVNVDKILIQLFWNAVEGGNYFAAYRLTRFLDMVTVAIGTLLLPTISMLYSKNNIQALKRVVVSAERYLSMIAFPIVFFMVFLPKPTIHILLSNRFYPAIHILQILPLFILFDALSRPYVSKLIGIGLPKFARNRVLIMVIINVTLNIILIPRDIRSLGIDLFGLGATGAAIATVIAYIAGWVYTRIVIWRVSDLIMNFRIILHFFAALVMGLVLTYLNTYVYEISRWYDLVGFGLLGLGIYLIILYVFREFTRKDFDLLIDTLNVKKMLVYIKDEIGFKKR